MADNELDEKVDAVVAALNVGLEEHPGSGLQPTTALIYAMCIVDEIETHGFKLVKLNA